MSLLKKFGLSFGAILILFLVVFGVVFDGLKNIEDNKTTLDDQIKLKDLVFDLKLHEKDYLLKETKNYENLVWKDITKIHTHIENTPGTLEEDIGMPKDLQNFKSILNNYTKLVEISKNLINQNRLNINKARKASEMLRKEALKELKMHYNSNSLETLEDQIVLLDYVTQLKIKEKNYLLYRDSKDYNLILSYLNKLKIHIENTPGSLEEDAGIPTFLANYKNGIEKLHLLYAKENIYQNQMRKYANNLISKANTLLTNANNSTDKSVIVMKSVLGIVFIVSIIVILGVLI